ncbi:MAG: DUF418 domain-containing protein [Myxococcota bacterium]
MTHERWPWLDALRGVALAGIALVNLTWFCGYAVQEPSARQALSTAALDPAVRTVIHVLVDAKLYSLFALLFGVGYELLRPRLGPRSWHRRMRVLLVLGALHASLLWFGDILGLYAVVGMLLPLSRRLSSRGLLVVAFACLAAPVVQHAMMIGVSGMLGVSGVLGVLDAPTEASLGPSSLLGAFGEGSVSEVLIANAAFLEMRWILALEEGRLFKLAGMFVLGVYAVRRGVVASPRASRPWLRRVATLGLVVGLPLEIVRAGLGPGTTLEVVLAALGVPALAVAYAAWLTLRPWLWFSPAGRMSLTHYLLQSVLGIAIFYDYGGYGLGLWGRVGPTFIVLLVVVQAWTQRQMSRWWLRRFGVGPVEALWRRLAR